MIGAAPVIPGVGHPLLVTGCLISAVPDVVLPGTVRGANSWSFQLPPLAGVTAYAQGVNDYFTTIGMTHDFQTSHGLRMDFR
jgi:hypothetical protein